MAEVKNAFIQSKMNKDLDSRLVPNGEYRNAINAQVSRSEGSDVGALENALGNSVQATFEDGQSYSNNLTCIGYVTDELSNCVYVFLTDGTRSTGEPYIHTGPGSNHFIYKKDVNSTAAPVKLVSGAFLNFSKNYPIYGVNLLENLLFWTDNFNQPRKINVTSASTPPTPNNYYTTEDQISVATYNPYKPIELYEEIDSSRVAENSKLTQALNSYDTTMRDVVSKFYPGGGTALVSNSTTSTDHVISNLNIPFYPAIQSTGSTGEPQSGMTVGFIAASSVGSGPVEDTGVTVVSYDNNTNTITLSGSITTTANDIFVFNFNPYYENSYAGDSRFLEDKFVRFSYRFKFDDGEYSIYAPFTQPCFIPKQDGYFLNTEETIGDQQNTFASTVVGFMENKVNEIKLIIPLPSTGDSLQSEFKVSEVDILFKKSDGLAVQVVETINISDINSSASGKNYYEYTYINKKPFKTLPESELIRVFDKVPVKALSQEVSSNRIIYGNFQNKHTPPSSLDYYIGFGEKNPFSINTTHSSLSKTSIVEYPSSSVKSNRTYQVGVVLSDKFGRQSSVILSNNKNIVKVGGISFSGDTIYAPYVNTNNIAGNFYEWIGSSLKMSFNSVIDASPNINNKYWPGIYNGNINSPDYNPLGWYSYKIVVKQQEQEYYNVYTAGAMKDIPYNYLSIVKGPPTPTNPITPNISFVTLLNDNINKVPRDLTEVGPQDKTFRSSVVLFGRVENTTHAYSNAGNKQFKPDRTSFTTNSIEDLFDLFDVEQFENNVNAQIPVTDIESPFSPFFKADANPFVGEFVTSQDATKQFGVLNEVINTNTYTANGSGTQPQPSPTIPLTLFSPGFTLEPGYKVTGGNIVDDVFVVSYDPAASEVVISEAITYAANTTFTFTQEDYLPIENLAILETAPTISNLDIYWETSSAGLISELNEAIRDSANSTQAFLTDTNDSAFLESLGSGQNIITNNFFEVINEFGTVIDKSLVNLQWSVVDSSGEDASSLVEVYELVLGGKQWNIRTTSDFPNLVWFSDQNNRYRNFTFTFSIDVDNSSNALVDQNVSTPTSSVVINILTSGFTPVQGAKVTSSEIIGGEVLVESYDSGTNTLTLNAEVTLSQGNQLTIANSPPSTSTITRTLELQNTVPSMFSNSQATPPPISGSVVDLGVVNLKRTILQSLSGVNGANVSNSGKDLDFELIDVIKDSDNSSVKDAFVLLKNNYFTNNEKISTEFWLRLPIRMQIGEDYTATIKLEDSGPASKVVDFKFNFGTIPSFISTMVVYFGPSNQFLSPSQETTTVIKITDQPAANNTNGIYHYKGTPQKLIESSYNNNGVITIDKTNASIGTFSFNDSPPFNYTCKTNGSDWAFVADDVPGYEFEVLKIVLGEDDNASCFYSPAFNIKGRTEGPPFPKTNELNTYKFEVK